MKTTIIGFIGLVLTIASLFIVPESTFGSFDNYCVSIITRCGIGIIMLLVMCYPAFEGNTKRFIRFTVALLGFGVICTALKEMAESYFGPSNVWLFCLAVSVVVFFFIIIRKPKLRVNKSTHKIYINLN